MHWVPGPFFSEVKWSARETEHYSESRAKVKNVVLEISRTIIVVTASVNEDERGGQGHTSASLLHQSAK
jgi:hypothetical protein